MSTHWWLVIVHTIAHWLYADSSRVGQWPRIQVTQRFRFARPNVYLIRAEGASPHPEGKFSFVFKSDRARHDLRAGRGRREKLWCVLHIIRDILEA
jgi:hypothetical protein